MLGAEKPQMEQSVGTDKDLEEASSVISSQS